MTYTKKTTGYSPYIIRIWDSSIYTYSPMFSLVFYTLQYNCTTTNMKLILYS